MHWLPTIFGGVALVATLYAVFYCYRCARFVEQSNKRSLSLKRIAELEAEMTEVTDSLAAYGESLKKLRSRVGMRNVRDKRKEEQLPDQDSEPEAYKAKVRDLARQRGLLR